MMNLLVKEAGELREGKRASEGGQGVNVEDVVHRIQLHSVKANLERVRISCE